jgi:hypothetical protein
MTGGRAVGILFARKIHRRQPTRAEVSLREILMVAKKGSESFISPNQDSVLELSLMLSRQQFDLLEQRAHAEGMSVAQFLRRLVHDSIAQEPAYQPQ